ncbi:NAD-dependent epimerase/dehydratase family protein [Lysobacter auxotrophicus]|uniref:NAD-dependent epimerase/dehydratase family protein n=1 Tax=Lysobacter auxotrophicus TaxID=2992573 RepID=A0ABN6UMB9_9GAMM|nr:NAD-dependent epimerase/dehydratase family protein [Lysobacter auxotrophicus]BDU17482.1 NAD-dependent epimerase/dehydratase family protein [Lysobacter auxotrophicus]
MIVVVGGRGRLGQAIARAHAHEDVHVLDRSVYEPWSAPGSEELVRRHFASGVAPKIVYVASGLLDPRLPRMQLDAVNRWLPRNIIDAGTYLGFHTVTFGTVMERLIPDANAYVASKAAFAADLKDRDSGAAAVTHLRIHTLFGGGAPNAFMFLGQMLSALRSQTRFAMTSGRQLREYHHIDDEVAAVRRIVDAGVTGSLDLSHGAPVSLRDIAEHVFASCGKSHLLAVGALPEPAEENYGHVFQRPAALDGAGFRPTLPAIASYLQDELARQDGTERAGTTNGQL